MKKTKILLVLLILTSTLNLFSQDYSELKKVNLSDSVNCRNAQPKVIECCDYLLNNPCVENLTSLNATSFIIEWMGATSDFTFSLEDNIYKVIKSDFNLTSRYYASLTKVALEKNYTKNCMELQLSAITALLEYCELPKNQVKISKKLQKYIDSKNAGTLKELIKI
jgi:hypothetical protein